VHTSVVPVSRKLQGGRQQLLPLRKTNLLSEFDIWWLVWVLIRDIEFKVVHATLPEAAKGHASIAWFQMPQQMNLATSHRNALKCTHPDFGLTVMTGFLMLSISGHSICTC